VGVRIREVVLNVALRHDPQGKMVVQILMDFPVRVPQLWIDQGWVQADADE